MCAHANSFTCIVKGAFIFTVSLPRAIQKLKSAIGQALFFLPNQLIKNGICFKLFNYLYERSPSRLACIIVGKIKIPNRNLLWNIRLINGKEVITKIYQDKPCTWQSALAYRWHVPNINRLEWFLNNYFDSSVPYIDIGANVGVRSLLYLSSGRRVFMFEPNRELNILNEECCRMNGFKNYKIFDECLSDSPGEAVFYYEKSSYRSGLHKEFIPDGLITKSEMVTCSTLDIVADTYLSQCSTAIIKIDVEGHEFEVIKGGRNFITARHPVILMEINEKRQHVIEIISFMKKLGYSVYELREREKIRYYRLPDSVDADNYVFRGDNYLFIQDVRLEAAFLRLIRT